MLSAKSMKQFKILPPKKFKFGSATGVFREILLI